MPYYIGALVSDDYSSSDSGAGSSDSFSGDSSPAGDYSSGDGGGPAQDSSSGIGESAGHDLHSAVSQDNPFAEQDAPRAGFDPRPGKAADPLTRQAAHDEVLPAAFADTANFASPEPNAAGSQPDLTALPPDANILGHGKQKSERPQASMDERLVSLRSRCRASVNTIGVICIIPGLGLGYIVGQLLSAFNVLTMAIWESIIPGQEWDVMGAGFLFATFLIPLALGGVFAWLLWKLALGHFARLYWRATQELDNTMLMAMVVNEEWTRILAHEAEQQMVIKWISPPEPKLMEHQLEFAASYYDQLRKMQFGRAQLDSSSLWNGALGWFAGQRNWCICAFVLSPCGYCGFIGLPFWILSGIYYLQKIAVTTAYCDFLLRDGPYAGPLPEMRKLMPANMRHAMRQP